MYWTALVIGFLGNFHCIGMCGPIALSLPVGRLNSRQKIFHISMYNLGRIVAYGLLGGLIGIFGLGLRYFGAIQVLSVISGILLLLIGLFSLPGLTFKAITAPKEMVGWVKKRIRHHLQQKKWYTFLSVGFFNGLLPCGLVYAGLVGSIVSSTWLEGIFYMMIFGLGTLPLMLFLPFISGMITQKTRIRMRKIVPYSLMFFGLLFIIRGSNLGIPYLSPKMDITAAETDIENAPAPVMHCH